jgi:hypothetical protein
MSGSFLLAPSWRTLVHIIYVVQGHNHLIVGSVLSAGCKHPQVALGGMSACVFIHVRIQCRIKSLGPFKGRVSTLATHLRGLLVSS